MAVETRSLFTATLGLQAPWAVTLVRADTAKRRIYFQAGSCVNCLTCPACGASDQGIHDRAAESWCHLDFFRHEAWLHADLPHAKCTACAKTRLLDVPWAHPGSGFTLSFEALALSSCQELPAARAADLLRVGAIRLWRRIAHDIGEARAKDDMSDVRLIGIDETSVKRAQRYMTDVHNLNACRLLFATAGRDPGTVVDFAADLQARGGDIAQIEHMCWQMRAAFAKGVREALPDAAVSYPPLSRGGDGPASDGPGTVCRDARTLAGCARGGRGENPNVPRNLPWGMRKNPANWNQKQRNAMHWLQRSTLHSARAWRLRMALRAVHTSIVARDDARLAEPELRKWVH